MYYGKRRQKRLENRFEVAKEQAEYRVRKTKDTIGLQPIAQGFAVTVQTWRQNNARV